MDTFKKPSEIARGDNYAHEEGNLVMFLGAIKDTFDGEYGESDVARCDLIVIIDETGDNHAAFNDQVVFGGRLHADVLNARGPLLGVITKKATGKKGQSKAWALEDPDPIQAERANEVYAANVTEKNGHYTWTPDEAPF